MKNIEDPRYRSEISTHFLQQVEFVRRKILNKCEPKRGYKPGSSVTGIRKYFMYNIIAIDMQFETTSACTYLIDSIKALTC